MLSPSTFLYQYLHGLSYEHIHLNYILSNSEYELLLRCTNFWSYLSLWVPKRTSTSRALPPVFSPELLSRPNHHHHSRWNSSVTQHVWPSPHPFQPACIRLFASWPYVSKVVASPFHLGPSYLHTCILSCCSKPSYLCFPEQTSTSLDDPPFICVPPF